MHLNAKRPVFVPVDFWNEIDKLSKAALMDMAWDYAAQACGEPEVPSAVMNEFRRHREIILSHRKQSQ